MMIRTATAGTSQAYRPSSQSGRPMSGVPITIILIVLILITQVNRPGSEAGRPGTMEAALRTPRTARTARPVSATSGRWLWWQCSARDNDNEHIQNMMWNWIWWWYWHLYWLYIDLVKPLWGHQDLFALNDAAPDIIIIMFLPIERFVRLGTASMLSQADGPFINLARWILISHMMLHDNCCFWILPHRLLE